MKRIKWTTFAFPAIAFTIVMLSSPAAFSQEWDSQTFEAEELCWDGVCGTGTLLIYYSTTAPLPLGDFNEPIIFVEGFDVANEHSADSHYGGVLGRNQEGLVDTLAARGHDVIFVDWDNPFAPIQQNAYLLVEMIDWINGNLDGPDDEISIVGCSMGGLVTRYALTLLEAMGWEHNTRLFLSFDAPQRGAQVMVGMQWFVEFLNEEFPDEAGPMSNTLNSMAAKQMARYHISDLDHVERDAFFNELESIGDYPRELRKVAISNGSGYGNGSETPPHEQVLDWSANALGGIRHYWGNVWSHPSSPASVTVLEAGYEILGIDHNVHTGTWSDSEIGWDSIPGGQTSLTEEVGEALFNYGGGWGLVKDFLTEDTLYIYHSRSTFIPSVSAMDINTSNWSYDVSTNPDIHELTPFNKLYFPVSNFLHMTITETSVDWFLRELAAIDLQVCDEVVESGQLDSQRAEDDIVVAGDGCTYTVESGGESTMRAGEKITLKPGFTAEAGSSFQTILL